MAEEFEEKRKRKGKAFSRKRIALVALILIIFSAGALFQHFFLEPLYGETVEQKYARCLTQKEVLDDRFAECANSKRACEYQLDQCEGRSVTCPPC